MNFLLHKISRLLIVVCVMFSTTTAHAEIRPGLAILYFDYTGQDPNLSVLKKGLAAMLINGVSPVSKTVTIVERERLESVLSELELAQSDKVDSSTAAKIGKLTGARYIVLGSFFDLFGTLRIDARLIKVETGEILGTVGREGPMNDFFALRTSLVDDLNRTIATLDMSQAASATPTKTAKPKSVQAKASTVNPKKPAPKITTATIVTYSKALDAKDNGDTKRAKELAQAVQTQNPSAVNLLGDLTSLMQ